MIVKTVDNKVVGTLDGGIFTKMVNGKKHLLLTPPAWAMDATIFDMVLRGRCKTILIIDRDEGNKQYASTFANFDEHKGVINRGYDKQYFLTIDRWLTKDKLRQMKEGLNKGE